MPNFLHLIMFCAIVNIVFSTFPTHLKKFIVGLLYYYTLILRYMIALNLNLIALHSIDQSILYLCRKNTE
jgi:hypothetical protein